MPITEKKKCRIYTHKLLVDFTHIYKETASDIELNGEI